MIKYRENGVNWNDFFYKKAFFSIVQFDNIDINSYDV